MADYFLCRILGNDLAPLHVRGQTRNNLAFVLEHEPDLPGCEKFWIVNRIFDPAAEAELIALLEQHNQKFEVVPFDRAAYAAVVYDTPGIPQDAELLSQLYKYDPHVRRQIRRAIRRSKNRYAMNNNGARNLALRLGRARSQWALPWDGNCFISGSAWNRFVEGVRSNPDIPYIVVPMARVLDNSALLDPDYAPAPLDEPQLAFRSDTTEMFDETYPYGEMPKVEMLWRLNVPGHWQAFKASPLSLPRPKLSPDAGKFAAAGWVARLSPGNLTRASWKEQETKRYERRVDAIVSFLDHVDASLSARPVNPETLTCYDEDRIGRIDAEGSTFGALRAAADDALANPVYSVVDKTMLPPSGASHDYFSIAHYFWPNPDTADGLPYLRRDGESFPEAGLSSEGQDKYDRVRLQRMIDDTLVLALAGQAADNDDYRAKAALNVRSWFLDPQTRMAPHLEFAQVVLGDEEASRRGLIDWRDLPLLLDAVRLLGRSGALTSDEMSGMRSWMRDFSAWMDESDAGRGAVLTDNNVGTFYEVQRGAIAAFLGDSVGVEACLVRARRKIAAQFNRDGAQPHEMRRARPLHYCAFNLEAWLSLMRLAASVKTDLWSFRTPEDKGLPQAFDWFVAETQKAPDGEVPDRARMAALLAGRPGAAEPPPDVPDVLDRNFATLPFWRLAR